MSDPVLDLPFFSGIDEATRQEHVQPGAGWAELVNVRQDAHGGATKRPGYDSLALTRLTAPARASGLRMLMNGAQICTIDTTCELDSLSTGADSCWVNKFRVPEATYRHLEVPTVGMGPSGTIEDVVVCGDVIAVSYYFQDTVGAVTTHYQMAALIDADTETVIRRPEAIKSVATTIMRTHLATYGVYIIAFATDLTNNKIWASYIDTTSRATIDAGWVSIGSVVTDAAGNACVASQADRVAIVYGNTSGGASRLTVKTLTIAGVVETVVINTSSITPSGPSLSEGGSTLWVAWAEEVAGGPPTVTNFKVIGLNPSDIDGTALATVATVIQTSRAGGQGAGVTWLVSTGATTGTLYAINENVFASDGINVRSFSTVAGATNPLSTTYKFCNSVPVGRPFARNGRVYMPLSSSILEECVLCDVTPPLTENFFVWRPVAAPINRGTFVLQSSNPRARCAVTSSSTYVFAFDVVKAGTSTNGIFGAALVEFDFASPYRWKPASLNGSTFLSGGVTCVYDGRRVCEAGFLCRPPPPTMTVSVAGSQTFTVGRRYVATYEEVDADGNWHVSGVSSPAFTGAITNKKVQLTVQPLTITARTEDAFVPYGSGARIGLWVTTNGGEAPYYRLATVANNVTSETIAYEDTSLEADFTSNALLYATGSLPGTNGSSQDHRAPPGLLYHVAYNGMLVGVTGKTIYFSSQPIDGEGTWFSPAFSVAGSIDDDATGITVQDGAVLIFTRGGIWTTAGEPPSDNGTSGGLSMPRKLAVDVGCINANSILTTSIGTFYRSENTIELFTRGQTTAPIGDKIQDTLAAFPIVTAAVLDTKRGLARFSLTTAMTDGVAATNGRDVVFDLSLGEWISVDDKRGSVASQASQDACMAYIGGAWRYAWLATNGTVYYERLPTDAAKCLDGANWATQRAVTPWVKIAGLNGEQLIDRILFLASKVSDHDLTISIAFDYASTYAETKTFTRANIAALAREWLEKGLTQTTHQAVRVKLEDATPTGGTVGTGEGATWIGVTFCGQPHKGPKRTAGTHRGGSN